MKVQIRPLKLSDAKAIQDVYNNKDVYKQITGPPWPCPLSYVENKIINRSIKERKTRKRYDFAIIVNNKVIGEVVLEHPDKTKKAYELGYMIKRSHWNKGIATKAIKQIVKFGFNKIKISKIWAGTSKKNPASGKALKKAGFKLKGIKNKDYYWEIKNS
jgi:RimJ/RimL family protein N-acetyltransferase